MTTLEVPDEFAIVVQAALRSEANGFYGAIARAEAKPGAVEAMLADWKARASFLDGLADRLAVAARTEFAKHVSGKY